MSKKFNKKDKKKKEEEKDILRPASTEEVLDYNPDDIEAGEELPGTEKVKKHRRYFKKDFNPDDYSEG